MAPPDMRLPIQHALTWPARLAAPWPRLSLAELGRLDFAEPEAARYPALALGYRALAEGGAAGAVLNAANEVAVKLFLAGRIRFGRVARIVEEAMDAVRPGPASGLEVILDADRRARAFVRERAA
jgi:1-deoxy-D-xylulose-5-phosphate reductoisomerase